MTDDVTLPPAPADPGQTLAAPATPAVPVAVPGYEILGELGRGGMGVVYQARQVSLSRVVALKMILAGGHADDAGRDRFRAEAEAIARLQHPNIVQVYEVGAHDGHPYFSLEFCDGGSLEKHLGGNPVPASDAAALVATLARAMQAAHDRGVVHRDLKPANVLLQHDRPTKHTKDTKEEPTEDTTSAASFRVVRVFRGESLLPKITDFGLARRLDIDSGQTRTGTIVGTPSYMAPEQAQGKTREIGPACDIYALGAILYECLTGRPPFKAATPLDTVLQVVADDPIPPTRLNRKVPRDLETITLKCLQKEPHRRYATADELAADLDRFRAGEPIRARPVGPAERVLKWVRRRPAIAGLVALVAVVTLLGVGGIFAQWRQAEEQREQAVYQSELADKARQLADQRADDAARATARAEEAGQLAEQRRLQAAQALDQARAGLYLFDIQRARRDLDVKAPDRALTTLYHTALDRRGWEYHHLRDRCLTPFVPLQGHRRDGWALAWSPDGATLATGDTDSRVLLWDVATARLRRELPKHRGWICDVAFSPDGTLLATATMNFDVPLSMAGGSFEQCTTGEVRLYSTKDWAEVRRHQGQLMVAFSHDGRHLAFVTGEQSRDVRVVEAATGKDVRTLTGHAQAVFGLAFTRDGKRLVSTAYDFGKIDLAKWDNPAPIRGIAGGVNVWDLATGKPTALDVPAGVHYLHADPAADRFYFGMLDGSIEVWSAKDNARRPIPARAETRLVGLTHTGDGKLLATYMDHQAVVWDPDTGEQLDTLLGPNSKPAVSPDGRRFATAPSMGHPARVFELHRGPGFGEIPLPREVLNLAWGPDGRRLAVLTGDRLRLFDAATLKETANVASTGIRLAFTPDGKHLVTGGRKASIFGFAELVLRDAATGEVRRRFNGHSDAVVGVSISADGKYLVSAACDPNRKDRVGEILVWDVQAGAKLTAPQPTEMEHAFSVAISADGALVAGAMLGRTVRVWDRATGAWRFDLAGHASAVNCVAFRPGNPDQLASGSVDGVIILWDLKRRTRLQEMKGHQATMRSDGGIVTLAFTADGERLASATYDGKGRGEVKVWDPDAGIEACSLPGQLTVAFSPDGRRLAAAGGEKKAAQVRIWEGKPSHEVKMWRGHEGGCEEVTASRDGSLFVTVGWHGRALRVWSAKTGEKVQELRADKGRSVQAAFSPDGRRLAAGDDGGRVRVWDLATGALVGPDWVGHPKPVSRVTFLDDARLATAGEDSSVRVWDVATRRLLHTLPTAPQASCLAVSPDGTRLAVGVGVVRVYDARTFEPLYECDDIDDWLIDVAFTPDGGRLVAFDAAGRLRLFDAQTGRQLAGVEDSLGQRTSMTVSRDGRFVVTVGHGGVVRVYDAGTLAEVVTWPGVAWLQGAAGVADGMVATAGAYGLVYLWKLPEKVEAKAPTAKAYPENESYLARLARQHHAAGRDREALDVALRWRTVSREKWDVEDPACAGLLALTHHRLGQADDAKPALARLQELMRNDWCRRDAEAAAALQQATAALGAQPADEADVRQTLVAAHHAGWVKHDVPAYLAAWAAESHYVAGRGEPPGPADVRFDRPRLEGFLKLRLGGKPDEGRRRTLWIDRVQRDGDRVTAWLRSVIRFPRGHFSATFRYELLRKDGAWKVTGCRFWPTRERENEAVRQYDAADWARQDAEAAGAAGDPRAQAAAYTKGYRHREAYALRTQVSERPGAVPADWLERATAAQLVGEVADAVQAVRRARRLRADVPLEPWMQAALMGP